MNLRQILVVASFQDLDGIFSHCSLLLGCFGTEHLASVLQRWVTFDGWHGIAVTKCLEVLALPSETCTDCKDDESALDTRSTTQSKPLRETSSPSTLAL